MCDVPAGFIDDIPSRLRINSEKENQFPPPWQIDHMLYHHGHGKQHRTRNDLHQ